LPECKVLSVAGDGKEAVNEIEGEGRGGGDGREERA